MRKIIDKMKASFSCFYGRKGGCLEDGGSAKGGLRETAPDTGSCTAMVLMSIGLGAGFSAAFLSMLSAL